MTRGRADNEGNVPTDDLHGLYYEQRASAGLIITEGAQVSLDAIGYINTAGIHTDEQVEGWKVNHVFMIKGKIFIQLWHVDVCLILIFITGITIICVSYQS
jgi:N-ethylmaleimide reductase